MAISPWHLVSNVSIDVVATLLAGIDTSLIKTGEVSYRQRKKIEEWQEVIVQAAKEGRLHPVYIEVLKDGADVPEGEMFLVSDEDWQRLESSDLSWHWYNNSLIRMGFKRVDVYAWLKALKIPDSKIPDALRVTPDNETHIIDNAQLECSDVGKHGADDCRSGVESQKSFSSHESEGLSYVNEVLEQFWVTYDPDDPDTAPIKKDVIEYLQNKGATKNMAMAVDLVCRPRKLQTAGLRQNRKSTR